MTKPILTYFNFPGGRGEASRLALHIAGAEWTDDRFAADWAEKKPTTPFGGLPTLEVPGKGTLSQSNAILGYIGREYGLLPKDSFEAARHAALMNAVEDLRAEAATTDRSDEDEKKKAREAFAEGYFQRWANNASAEIKGPFVGGEEISVADLKMFVSMNSYTKGVYDHIPKEILEAFPKITALMDAVASHPRVVDWYAKPPA